MFKSPFLDTKKTDDTMQIFWNAMQNSGKGKANFYEQGLLQILLKTLKFSIKTLKIPYKNTIFPLKNFKKIEK